MSVQFENVGFRRPAGRARPLTPRNVAVAQLITTAALVMSIAVAATAVSIGIARADTLVTTSTYEDSIVAIVAAGAVLVAMGFAVTRSGASQD